MSPKQKPDLTETQQQILDGVVVRLIEPHEREAFDQRLVAEHYVHSADLVGEQLRYVAEHQSRATGWCQVKSQLATFRFRYLVVCLETGSVPCIVNSLARFGGRAPLPLP